MDGGAWQATARGVAKSWTRLSYFTFGSLVPQPRVKPRALGRVLTTGPPGSP